MLLDTSDVGTFLNGRQSSPETIRAITAYDASTMPLVKAAWLATASRRPTRPIASSVAQYFAQYLLWVSLCARGSTPSAHVRTPSVRQTLVATDKVTSKQTVIMTWNSVFMAAHPPTRLGA